LNTVDGHSGSALVELGASGLLIALARAKAKVKNMTTNLFMVPPSKKVITFEG
jgi:hypothetical protein